MTLTEILKKHTKRVLATLTSSIVEIEFLVWFVIKLHKSLSDYYERKQSPLKCVQDIEINPFSDFRKNVSRNKYNIILSKILFYLTKLSFNKKNPCLWGASKVYDLFIKKREDLIKWKKFG